MNCNNCPDCDPLITDKCLVYTGPDIEDLGICKGMNLFEVEAIILAKLQESEDISLIKYETLTTTCAFIVSLLVGKPSQPFTLQQFAEVVFDGFCKLDAKIQTITPETTSFNTSCLTGDVSTRDKIIQALITKVCTLTTKVTDLETTSVKQGDLCSQVKACIESVVPVQSSDFNTRMVPYAPIPYVGSLSNFDNTGKGLVAAGFDKVYLMNGLNGTQDWRGRSPIGAIRNVPGATLDSTVDPNVSGNASYNYNVGSKYGTSSETLTSSQIPTHSHTVNDPGHKHTFSTKGDRLLDIATGAYIVESNPDRTGTFDANMQLAQTNITINSAGGSLAHNNLHPTVACLYIVHFP